MTKRFPRDSNSNNNNNNDTSPIIIQSPHPPPPSTALLIHDNNNSRSSSSSPATRLNENLIKKVANSLTLNERAKYEIVAQNAGVFYEILLIKLRQTILADRQRALQIDKEIEAKRSAETGSLLGVLSPRNLLGPTSPTTAALGSAAVVTLAGALSQSTTTAALYQQLGARALVAFVVLEKLKATLEVLRLARERDTLANLVNEFTGGIAVLSPQLAATEEERLERNVKLVCEVIVSACRCPESSDGPTDHHLPQVRRHVEQIVPLSRASHRVLADLIVRRIRDHFQRSPRGYASESRVPLVSALQLLAWTLEERYRSLLLPADKRALPPPRASSSFNSPPDASDKTPSSRGGGGGRRDCQRPLSLPDRAIRALTFEHRPEDDFVRLEFEPFFAPPSSEISWTAGGLLSRCGLRVETGNDDDDDAPSPAESLFALHPNDAHVYGFANATMDEVKRRGMHSLSLAPLPAVAVASSPARPRPRL